MKRNISKVIKSLGGQSEIARKLGIKQTSVFGWIRRGNIPAARVLQIEKLSNGNFTRHQLRPDLYPLD